METADRDPGYSSGPASRLRMPGRIKTANGMGIASVAAVAWACVMPCRRLIVRQEERQLKSGAEAVADLLARGALLMYVRWQVPITGGIQCAGHQRS